MLTAPADTAPAQSPWLAIVITLLTFGLPAFIAALPKLFGKKPDDTPTPQPAPVTVAVQATVPVEQLPAADKVDPMVNLVQDAVADLRAERDAYKDRADEERDRADTERERADRLQAEVDELRKRRRGAR